MKLYKKFEFEASHILPKHSGKCANLHGHSWVLKVYVEGSVNKVTGMVMDYSEIKDKIKPIINDLDHSHLGAWDTDLVTIVSKGTKEPSWLLKNCKNNPTSENLLLALGVEFWKRTITFSKLELNETCTVGCIVTWNEVIDYLYEIGVLIKEEVGYRG